MRMTIKMHVGAELCPAVEAGLSVNDEIISINGWRVNETLESHDSKHKVGDVAEILYSRDDKIYSASLIYTKNPKVAMKLEIGDKNSLYTSWLHK
jgi:predicted metalloprotease with PDZ domain